jgi:hypothetical protein
LFSLYCFPPNLPYKMEPLSGAASVIAVVQIAQSVAIVLRDLYRVIRDARSQIDQLYNAIVSLEIIAKGIEDLLKRGAMTNTTLLEDPNGPSKQVLLEIRKVKERLDVHTVDGRFKRLKLSKRSSAKQVVGWPFKKGEVLDIIEILEKHKSSLILNVDVNNL